MEIALLQTGGSREDGIVVSTLAEAEFFADAGFQDILYAVPLAAARLDRVRALHARIPRFHVLLDHEITLAAVQAAFTADADADDGTVRPLRVFLKVDCGYHRAGVDPSDPASIDLARRIATGPGTTLVGVYAHSGHAYNCAGGSASATEVARAEAATTAGFAAALRAAGLSVPVVSVGSTPASVHFDATMADGVTEVHPGNYVFFDRQQEISGACGPDDVGCYVLARVLSHYPKRNQLLLDAGGLAMHKDSGGAGVTGWGRVLGHPELALTSMSQEVCLATCSSGPIDWSAFPIGSVVRIAPNHSCMTAAMHAVYHVVDADFRVVDTWTPCKGW